MAGYRLRPPVYYVAPSPAPQGICSVVQQHGHSISALRKMVDQQGASIKELLSAQARTDEKIREVMVANDKVKAQLADHARVLTQQAGIINQQASAIESLKHGSTVLSADASLIGVIIGLATLLMLLKRRSAKPSKAVPVEQLYKQALAQGRVPTAEELIAALDRTIGRSG